MTEYCRCRRWWRFYHVVEEHEYFEKHARTLAPRRWAKEQKARNAPEKAPSANDSLKNDAWGVVVTTTRPEAL